MSFRAYLRVIILVSTNDASIDVFRSDLMFLTSNLMSDILEGNLIYLVFKIKCDVF